MYKKIVCFDFDGVVHSYDSGWQGPGVVADGPTQFADGSTAIDMVKEFLSYTKEVDGREQKVYQVAIYSSRSGSQDGLAAMQAWMQERLAPELYCEIAWPRTKPAAFVTIDDRGITFTGERIRPSDLEDFKPWNK